MRAVLNGTVLAESDDTVVVEGNHYFPPDAVRWDHLRVVVERSPGVDPATPPTIAHQDRRPG